MPFLPQDPVMLLSYANTKLRDCYPSLKDFCEEEELSESELCARLASIGYEYDSEKNRFI